MKRVLDWSRPRTWILLGLLIAVLGAVIMSATGDEGAAGPAVIVVGVALLVIGIVAYVVTQIMKAAAAARE